MPEISAFKNYTPGDPTCRLYIKNLAKTVEEKVRDSLFIKVDIYGHLSPLLIKHAHELPDVDSPFELLRKYIKKDPRYFN